MNSILRKTLVAVAIAGTFGANSATISSVDYDTRSTAKGIQQVISAQGLAIVDGNIVTGNEAGTSRAPVDANQLQVAWTPEINYENGDAIVFTFTGAAIDSTTTVSGISLRSSAASAVSGVSVIGLDRDAGTVTLSVSNAATASLSTAASSSVTYYLSGVVLDTAGASTVSVSSSSLRGQIGFDQSGSTEVAQIANQWLVGDQVSATRDKDLNGEIDVTRSRYVFSDRFDGDIYLDQFDISVFTVSNLMTTTATAVTSVVTTTGNFDWALDGKGKFDTRSVDIVTANGGAKASESLNDDQDQLTLTLSGNADDGRSTWNFDVPGDVTLVEGSYSATTSVAYVFNVSGGTGGTPGTMKVGDSSIGAWTLGGTKRFVEFMPYGSGIANFFYISNTSSVDAGIELTAYSDTGESFDCGELSVNAAGNSVTNLGVAVNEALAACGLGNSGDRLALSFTVNANDNAIDLTAGYNVRGNRVLVD